MMPHERRLSLRKPLKHLCYLSLPRDNGGIVLDVSEGGVRFRSIAPLNADGPIRFRFAIDSAARIAATGELAWKDETGKTGGLRFTQLPDEIREQIRVWAAQPTNSRKASAKASATTSAKVDRDAGPRTDATASATDIVVADLPAETEVALTANAVLESATATPLTESVIRTEVAHNTTHLSPAGTNGSLLLDNRIPPVYSAPSFELSMFPPESNVETRMSGVAERKYIGRHPVAAVALAVALALLSSVGIFSYILTSDAAQPFVEWGEKAWSGFSSQRVPPQPALPPSAPDSSKSSP